MICTSKISDNSTPCKGEVKAYKIDGWAAPVPLCIKHLAEYTLKPNVMISDIMFE